MNDLMSVRKISSFGTVLAAYKKAGIDLRNALDGGAGSGSTAKQMLNYLSDDAHIYAFEPFLGNHRFFAKSDHRIELIPKALAESNKSMTFYVPSTVGENSKWGKHGMTGYSSVGYLQEIGDATPNAMFTTVDCVRADDFISQNDQVGFIKLDLQGGELNALKGMPRLLSIASFLWIEYIGTDPLLYDFLVSSDFIVFDTEYFFLGEPTDEAREIFDVSKEGVTLSTGATAWFGFKKMPWSDFRAEFQKYRTTLKMVQTDFLCINKKKVDQFLRAAPYL